MSTCLTSSSSAAASRDLPRRTNCTRRGVGFVLLERQARAGGVILSEQIDGFTIDGGPDALLIQKPDGIKLCQELGLGDRLVPTKPPRLAYIQRAGRLHRAAGRLGARHSHAWDRSSGRGSSRGRASCGWAPSCSFRARRDDAATNRSARS